MKRAVMILSVIAMVATLPLAARSQRRQAAEGRLLLELGGVTTAVDEAEGGEAYSDVVSEKLGPDHVVHKHLSGVKFADITVSYPLGEQTKLVQDFLSNRSGRANGAVIATDF